MFFLVPFGILTRPPYDHYLNFERQKENKYHENYRPGPKERTNMIASEYFEMLNASEWQVANLDTFLREVQGGATLKNAGILAEYTPKQIKKIESIYAQFCNDELDEPSIEFVVGFYVSKAVAYRDKRWIGFVEAGGKQASAGMWLLERRVGGEFGAPVQKVQQEIKAGVMYSSVQEAIEATQKKLGIKQIEEQGDYWAKLQTAAALSQELPVLPIETPNKKD